MAYDRSVDALANLGGQIVDVALPTRFADLGAINGRIMSAEAYAALAELVDDRAQPRDQDVRPRVRAGASISSRTISSRWQRQRMKGSFNAAIEGINEPMQQALEETLRGGAFPPDSHQMSNTTPCWSTACHR